jgi:uncharacterized integral membrane protein
MKRENWMLILGTCVAISLLCGLILLLAAQPTVVASVGTSIALADAPLGVKILVGLAALVSGSLLLAPLFQAQLKTLH